MMKKWKQWQVLFSWAPKSLQIVTAAMKLKYTGSLKGNMTKLDSVLKSRDIILLLKVHIVKAMVSPEVVQMWELDHKEAEHWKINAFKLC